MPDGVASTRRLNAGSGSTRYVIVMVVCLARCARDRRVARDRLFPRDTLVLQSGIDFLPGKRNSRRAVRESFMIESRQHGIGPAPPKPPQSAAQPDVAWPVQLATCPAALPSLPPE